MADTSPGLGSPEGALREAARQVAEHDRLHQGERKAPISQDLQVTHPARPAAMPEPSGPSYPEGRFDPARQAQVKRQAARK